MNYAIITENDESQWDDETGLKYHFPSRYVKYLRQGTQVIYYKGRLKSKKFENRRLSNGPHYFAIAEIGEITEEKGTTNYYAGITKFKMFLKAISFKLNNEPIEQIPESRIGNYWRDGVRPINHAIYNKIVSLAAIDNSENDLNDQKEGEYTTTFMEGGKQRIYSTKYERRKDCRDRALRIHGYSCKVCDFNFKETYGDHGEGFIHVHHLKPLSSNSEEIEINPETDLTVVCANCHAMIHRRKNVLLTIEELKGMMRK